MRGHAFGVCHILVVRARLSLLRRTGKHLQLVVGHAGQEIIRVAIAIEVSACNAHAPDAQRLPAVGFGIKARRLAGENAPELLLAAFVIFPVV